MSGLHLAGPHPSLGGRGAAGGAGVPDELARATVQHPRKSPAPPTGQVSGVGRSPIFSWIRSMSPSAETRTVPLVDDGDHQDPAEQVQTRNSLSVWVRVPAPSTSITAESTAAEHPVGVLGEVAVAGVSTRLTTWSR